MNKHDDDFRPLRRTWDDGYGAHALYGPDYNLNDVAEHLRRGAIPRLYDPHYEARHSA